MIDDLDKTLKELLNRELPADLVKELTISFATPDDRFPPDSLKLPAIDLFLYDVRENRDLRSNEWLVERQNDGTATKKRFPVRVEGSYLITAWPSNSSSSFSSPDEEEHYILGEVMKALLHHSTIPDEVLQGELQNQQLPLPTSTLQPGHLQNLGEFWQALGGKPKAALNYTVTISVEAHKPVEVKLVTDKRIRPITD
jgi:hypothetical protein